MTTRNYGATRTILRIAFGSCLAILVLAVPQLSHAATIAGVTVSDFSSNYPGRTAENTVNGSGCPGCDFSGGTHDNFSNNQFQANFQFDPHYIANDGLVGHIVWDLGAVYDVSAIRIWNFRETDGRAGTLDMNILVSATSDLSGLTASGSFTTLSANSLLMGGTPITGQVINESFTARYVRLEQITRQGVGSQFPEGPGIAEIRFDGTLATVPEPSSFALAGLGLVGLIGWRLRRR